ncbi:MAG: response regulator transcription factor [Polyangia bacterium]
MIRIFIADDHAIVRHGLRQLIETQPDMVVVGEASDGRQVLLAEGKQDWDILLLDLSLPRVNGIEVLRRLRSEHPSLRVVALSMYPEEQYADRLLGEGAVAYLSKEQSPQELLAVFRQVVRGGGPPRRAAAQQARAEGAAAPHEALSAREYQIFTLILQNRRVTEIAAELNLSVSTVSNHLTHVKEKLGVRSVGEIISYGHRVGLISTI